MAQIAGGGRFVCRNSNWNGPLVTSIDCNITGTSSCAAIFFNSAIVIGCGGDGAAFDFPDFSLLPDICPLFRDEWPYFPCLSSAMPCFAFWLFFQPMRLFLTAHRDQLTIFYFFYSSQNNLLKLKIFWNCVFLGMHSVVNWLVLSTFLYSAMSGWHCNSACMRICVSQFTCDLTERDAPTDLYCAGFASSANGKTTRMVCG